MYGNKGEVPDGDFLLPFGVADVKRVGKDCTVVAWGQACLTALAAAEQLEKEHGISVEVVDPRTLRPLDLPAIVKSVKKTGYCVTVETGYPTCGVGAEIAALVHEHCFDDLDNHVVRVAALDVPMPYSKPLLLQVVPMRAAGGGCDSRRRFILRRNRVRVQILIMEHHALRGWRCRFSFRCFFAATVT